jgi:hypothetical protein
MPASETNLDAAACYRRLLTIIAHPQPALLDNEFSIDASLADSTINISLS